jgi:hypothetical protein
MGWAVCTLGLFNLQNIKCVGIRAKSNATLIEAEQNDDIRENETCPSAKKINMVLC